MPTATLSPAFNPGGSFTVSLLPSALCGSARLNSAAAGEEAAVQTPGQHNAR
jgi:hypothetical protein